MIVVFNGTPLDLPGFTVSYRKIAELAGREHVSVTYKLRNGEGGTLSAGDVLALGEGMVINAYNTGSA